MGQRVSLDKPAACRFQRHVLFYASVSVSVIPGSVGRKYQRQAEEESQDIVDPVDGLECDRPDLLP